MGYKLLLLYFFCGMILWGQEKKSHFPVDEIESPKKKDLILPEGEYRTPRAGKALSGTLLGLIDVDVEERDRSNITAIAGGAYVYFDSPPEDEEVKVGEENVLIPFAAFYHTNAWEENTRRVRFVLAGLANFISFYEGSWNSAGIEIIGTWENYTIPFASSIEIDEEEIKGTEIYWGHLRAGLGLGWRTAISPFEVDNHFAIYAFYEPGFVYFHETRDTAKNYIVPDNTYEGRINLRVRMDALERNIMELRHSGWAFGADYVRGRRERWQDHDFNGSFSKDDTQDFDFASGYVTWAGGPGWASERHRFILSLHGGFSPSDSIDRYSAVSLGGGPSGDESESLARSVIPGVKFDEYLVDRYFLFTAEYRLELLFFLYVSIKGVIGEIRKLEFDKKKGELSFSDKDLVGSVGVSATMGFIWDSVIFLEYVNDHGILGREEKNGHSVLLSWSKAF